MPHGISIRWHTGFKRNKKKPVSFIRNEDDTVLGPLNQLQFVKNDKPQRLEDSHI